MGTSALEWLAESMSGKRSRRAAIAAGSAGMALGVLGLAAERVEARRASTGEFSSGGLGLSFAEFEARYGPGTAGQGAQIYAIGGETYAVLGTAGTDAVTSIYWTAKPQQSVEPDEALAKIAPFFPDDAKLREVYTTPAAGITPFATVHLYKSAGLAKALAGGPTVTSGNFLVAFQLVGGFDTTVTGVNAFVGAKP
jgi:hypothetical protein